MITVNSNLKIITPKGLTKSAAKNTGRALVEGYKSGSHTNENVYHTMITPVPRSSSNLVNSVKGPSTSGIKNDIKKKD